MQIICSDKYLPTRQQARTWKVCGVSFLVRICPFTPTFVDFAFPVRRLLYRNSRYEWDDECKKVFKTLLELIYSPAYLSQMNEEGDEKFFAFRSRAFISHQQCYVIAHLNLMSFDLCHLFNFKKKFILRLNSVAQHWKNIMR